MHFDDSHIAQLLSHYPACHRSTWSACQVSGGFSAAIVVRITTQFAEFALRGWPTGSTNESRIIGLHRLLRCVHDQEIRQVAVPIATNQGRTLISAFGRWWQLEPWMPGVADFANKPTNEKLRAAMQCLARWHRAAATFSPRGDECTWFESSRSGNSPAVMQRLAMLQRLQHGDARRLAVRLGTQQDSPLRSQALRVVELFQHLAARTESELERARALSAPLQPCLRDVWHDHVLYSNDEVTGLIDPSACRTESVAADLARLLGSLLDEHQRQWALALDEYATVRVLSNNELALVPVLYCSGVLLSAMTWVERIAATDGQLPPSVGERLSRQIRSLEAMAGRAG